MIAISLISLLLLFLPFSFASHIAGIKKSELGNYLKLAEEGKFQCLNSNEIIPFSHVNDNFCDCDDGSDEPGTSACKNGKFWCENKGYVGMEIPSSRVDDFICDCCDGSDETYSGKKCVNNCVELGKSIHEKREKDLIDYREGLILRIGMVNKAVEEFPLKEEELKKEDAELAELRAKRDELKPSLDVAEERETAERNRIAEEKRIKQEEKDRIEKEAAEKCLDDPDCVAIGDNNSNENIEGEENVANHHQQQQETEKESEEAPNVVDDSEIKEFVDNDDDSNNADSNNDDDFDDDFDDGDDDDDDDDDIDDIDDIDNAISSFVSMIFKPFLRLGNILSLIFDDEIDDYDYDYDDDDVDHKFRKSRKSHRNNNNNNDHNKNLYIDPEAKSLRDQISEFNRKIRAAENSVRELREILDGDYGKDKVYFALRGQCFSDVLDKYTYEICPFAGAKQSGDSHSDLGSFAKFEDDYTKMAFKGGASCWQGPQRSITAHLKCGSTNKLSGTYEPSKCIYETTFHTPAACDNETYQALLQEAERIKHDEL